MSITVRKTGGRAELDVYANIIRGLMYMFLNATSLVAAIDEGTTAGFLRTTANALAKIDGVANVALVAQDDFWDLTGETDTVALQFRAYWLYVDDSNAASFVAGGNSDSEAGALRLLPVLDGTKSIIGTFVAGPATDFDDAGGLAAQGTISDLVPDGAAGVIRTTDITLVAP